MIKEYLKCLSLSAKIRHQCFRRRLFDVAASPRRVGGLKDTGSAREELTDYFALAQCQPGPLASIFPFSSALNAMELGRIMRRSGNGLPSFLVILILAMLMGKLRFDTCCRTHLNGIKVVSCTGDVFHLQYG